MEFFGTVVAKTIEILKLEITIYGFTFSFWNVFLWALAAGIVIFCIRRAFGD